MNLAQLYESLTAAGNLSGWQEMYVNFYKAWFLNDRWMQYFKGLLTTIEVTVIALIIGVALGVVVAVIRTAHDKGGDALGVLPALLSDRVALDLRSGLGIVSGGRLLRLVRRLEGDDRHKGYRRYQDQGK